jgi:hypothetical protein
MVTMFTMKWHELYDKCPVASVGMSLEGDDWGQCKRIIPGDENDKAFFGTDLRYEIGDAIIPSLPCIVTITGKAVYITRFGGRKMRVTIKTWDCNENPVEFKGYLWL